MPHAASPSDDLAPADTHHRASTTPRYYCIFTSAPPSFSSLLIFQLRARRPSSKPKLFESNPRGCGTATWCIDPHPALSSAPPPSAISTSALYEPLSPRCPLLVPVPVVLRAREFDDSRSLCGRECEPHGDGERNRSRKPRHTRNGSASPRVTVSTCPLLCCRRPRGRFSRSEQSRSQRSARSASSSPRSHKPLPTFHGPDRKRGRGMSNGERRHTAGMPSSYAAIRRTTTTASLHYD